MEQQQAKGDSDVSVPEQKALSSHIAPSEPYHFRHFTMRADMVAAMRRYVEQREPLGDFLTCVLENDLMGALGRADDNNLFNIPAICAYVYNEMPSPCHGSREKVSAWLAAQ